MTTRPSITSPPPPSPAAHQLNTGTIVAITLSALAVVLASTLALCFLSCRRGRRLRSRTSKRASVGSSNSQQHLEPHTYRGRWSRRLSSVWTGFGSVSVIPGIDPPGDVWRHSDQLSFRLADSEKTEPDASPRPSLAPTEARSLVRDVSVHSLHEGIARVQATSPSSELLALAGIDYIAAGPVRNKGSEWRRSIASRVTASSGGFQSVEAM
ncbi:hypothetical protein GSI_08564 [Ganoderma sinense ZZ0214-1]|uniref:Uncharacterized protein n=1 Tax=Ganoderma sinense ZZ0214-1 TaxID=1077348 RepID=A0A2G8S425_9APHY|nr:hypothetical protein GSI_08564 [Ganoderma sinense ZZ0214-1]